METTEIVACRIVPLSRRIIPLPEIVATELTRHITLHARGHGDHLFAKRNGEPMSADYCWRRILYPAVTRSGLVAGAKGVVPHDLRNHYASVLLAAGESVFAVAERLGHKNGGLVLKTYGHLMPDGDDRTRVAIDAAWSASL